MEKADTLNLKRRYLIWLYKTTKESLDRIARKFTQLEIDHFLLKELVKSAKGRDLDKFISDFKAYIQKKEKDARLTPECHFLTLKLKAIEKTIIKELGKKVLKEIKSLYEEEMTRRILQKH